MLYYTLLVRNENEHIVTAVGPISKVGAGIVRETIVAGLKANQEYSLQVQVLYHSQLATSEKHHFCKLMQY